MTSIRNLRFPAPSSAVVFTLATFIGACSIAPVGPNYHQPEEAIASQPAAAAQFAATKEDSGASTNHAKLYSPEPLPAYWWRLFNAPQLDSLIDQALQHNTDLRQAVANLEQVRDIEHEVAGTTAPTASLSGSPYYGHSAGNAALQPEPAGYVPANKFDYSLGANLSYQVDLFGQLRRAIEVAQAHSEGAEDAVDLVRVNVAANTARAYAEVCSIGLRIKDAEKQIDLQKESVNAIEQLQHAGRSSFIDVARAQVQLQQLHAGIAPLRSQRQGALFRLATLTGALPEAFPRDVADCNTPPHAMSTIPVGDGAQLLRRRPDIRQAERNLAAATAQIGVVTADLYPKITLGLSASSASTMKDFAGTDSTSWSVGPLISWTIPNYNIVTSRIAQTKAGADEALAKFDGTVLNALRETETALSNYSKDLDRHSALKVARDENELVANQVHRLYDAGKTNYLNTLDADLALANSVSILDASTAQLADDQILLFLALGGGWEQDIKTH